MGRLLFAGQVFSLYTIRATIDANRKVKVAAMQYAPSIVGGWNEASKVVGDEFSNEQRDVALEPLYDLMTEIPLPMTRQGLEIFLQKALGWLKSNKYPFGGDQVWLEDVYIVIHGDNRLIAEMEVSQQGWQLTQCMV